MHLICSHYLADYQFKSLCRPTPPPPLLQATAARDLRPPLLLGPPPPLQPPLHCPLPTRIFLLHSKRFSLGLHRNVSSNEVYIYEVK